MMIPVLSNIPSSALDSQIGYLLGLLTQETSSQQLSQDTEKKIVLINDLLKEYIIANQKGNPEEQKDLLNRINQLIQSVGEEGRLFEDVHQLVKNVGSDPSSWPDLLSQLQQLSDQLKDPINRGL